MPLGVSSKTLRPNSIILIMYHCYILFVCNIKLLTRFFLLTGIANVFVGRDSSIIIIVGHDALFPFVLRGPGC